LQKWRWEEEQGLRYITIPHWKEQGAIALFSSRMGGCSETPYNSLNLALHVGDDAERVLKNRRRFLGLWGCDAEQLVCCEQVHGNKVIVVGPEHAGCGSLSLATAIKDCDALVTSSPGLVLATFYADCIPLYFFDPGQKIIGLAHSGWKGTMQKIACACLEVMKEKCNTRIQDVEVFIGPGIGPCCFKISKELSGQVHQALAGFDRIIYEHEDCYTWDLRRTNRLILEQNGVKPDKIYDCQLCTSCHPGDFYSYRRDQGKTGRMGAFIFVRS